MNMNVQIGISCPSEYEGRITKSMFIKKSVQIEYANWETASYICPKCEHRIPGLGNYITKLQDQIKDLKTEVEGLYEELAGADI